MIQQEWKPGLSFLKEMVVSGLENRITATTGTPLMPGEKES